VLLRSIRNDVEDRIKALRTTYPRFQPQLTVLQDGNRPDSSAYIRMKAKVAEEIGIKFNHINIADDASVEDIVSLVKKLNTDDDVSGVLVQLPLGGRIGQDGERIITQSINPEKDVDGYAFFCIICLFYSFDLSTSLFPEDSMLSTSVISSLAALNLSSPLARPPESSSYWNTLMCPYLALLQSFLVAVILLAILSLLC
jgi:hypothetical protein